MQKFIAKTRNNDSSKKSWSEGVFPVEAEVWRSHLPTPEIRFLPSQLDELIFFLRSTYRRPHFFLNETILQRIFGQVLKRGAPYSLDGATKRGSETATSLALLIPNLSLSTYSLYRHTKTKLTAKIHIRIFGMQENQIFELEMIETWQMNFAST